MKNPKPFVYGLKVIPYRLFGQPTGGPKLLPAFLRILRLFGDTETKRVTAQVGPERKHQSEHRNILRRQLARKLNVFMSLQQRIRQ